MAFYKTYPAPPYEDTEILRYAGCKEKNEDVLALLEACKTEAADKLSFKVCYLPLSVSICEDDCDFGVLRVKSRSLARNLTGCKQAVLFAATVGVGIERLIAKYGALSPVKALLFDAIGTERVEALCDVFCADMEQQAGLFAKPRFSPGYADLPLSIQKDVFSVLDCRKHIGLTVTESLMMSPSKSVTAILGLCEKNCGKPSEKCKRCGKTDCAFRSTV